MGDERESKASTSGGGGTPLNRNDGGGVPEAQQLGVDLDLDPRDASLVRWLAGSESSEAGAEAKAGTRSDATASRRRRCTLLDRDDALWTTGDPPPLALRMGVPLHAIILANVARDFAKPSLPTANEGARFEGLQIAYHRALRKGGGEEGVEKKTTTTETETTACCPSLPATPPLLRLSPRMILEDDARRIELKRRCGDHLDTLAREAERKLLDGVDDESRRAEGRARRAREARRRKKRRGREKTKRGGAGGDVEAVEGGEETLRRRPDDDVASAKNGDGCGSTGSAGTCEEEENVELQAKPNEDRNSATAVRTQEDIVGSKPPSRRSSEGGGAHAPPNKPSQSKKETSGLEGGSGTPDDAEDAEAAAAAAADENTSPNGGGDDDAEEDDAGAKCPASKTRQPPSKSDRVVSYLDAAKSQSSRGRASAPPGGGVPPGYPPHPPPSPPTTPSAPSPSPDSSSSAATTSTDAEEEEAAVVVDRLERQLESQRREHLEMIQQVQLRAFIAETRATAAVDRTRELERRLLDATYPEVAAAEGGAPSSPTRPTPTKTARTREHLELQLRSQRRDHLAMMRRVQLRTYLAETKARAAGERSGQLEGLLAREGGDGDGDGDGDDADAAARGGRGGVTSEAASTSALAE